MNLKTIKPILDTIKFPCHYDSFGQKIFDCNGLMICDVRGWGWIQYLDPDGDKAKQLQDDFGHIISDQINRLAPSVTKKQLHKKQAFYKDLMKDIDALEYGEGISLNLTRLVTKIRNKLNSLDSTT